MEHTESQKNDAKECSKEINVVLQKYNCDFSCRVIIWDNGKIGVEKSIVPLPPKIPIIKKLPFTIKKS